MLLMSMGRRGRCRRVLYIEPALVNLQIVQMQTVDFRLGPIGRRLFGPIGRSVDVRWRLGFLTEKQALQLVFQRERLLRGAAAGRGRRFYGLNIPVVIARAAVIVTGFDRRLMDCRIVVHVDMDFLDGFAPSISGWGCRVGLICRSAGRRIIIVLELRNRFRMVGFLEHGRLERRHLFVAIVHFEIELFFQRRNKFVFLHQGMRLAIGIVVQSGRRGLRLARRLRIIVETAEKLTLQIQRGIKIRLCPIIFKATRAMLVRSNVIISRRTEVHDPRQFHQRIVFVQRTLAVITGICTAVRHGVFLTQTLDAKRRLHTLLI